MITYQVTFKLVCLFALVVSMNGVVFAVSPALQELSENVRANEAIFRDIDIEMSETYELLGKPIALGGQFTPTKRSSSHLKYVRQMGKQRIEVNKDYTPVGRDLKTKSKLLAYDGEITRILGNGVANIRSGPYTSRDMVDPHMLLFDTGYRFPLSAYLTGADAIRAYPGAQWPQDRRVEVELLTDEVVEGRTCQRVRISNVKASTGRASVQWLLWLDTERNYLPIKRQCFMPRFSDKVSIGEAHVEAMDKYATGVWIPRVVDIVAFDKPTVMRTGEQKVLWKRQFKIELLNLNPSYPDRYFSDIEIPDGTVVHHVTADGKISRSEFIGEPIPPKNYSFSWRALILVANILLVAVLIILIARQRFSMA